MRETALHTKRQGMTYLQISETCCVAAIPDSLIGVFSGCCTAHGCRERPVLWLQYFKS